MNKITEIENKYLSGFYDNPGYYKEDILELIKTLRKLEEQIQVQIYKELFEYINIEESSCGV